MRIIQSCCFIGDNYNYVNGDKNYLMNFYTMLWSYIKLKEFYGYVTMYCNQKAYNEVVKYIPYDEVIIDETIGSDIKENEFKNSWFKIKYDTYQKQTQPFIHIDTDVIFGQDLLTQHIKNGFDVIVQSIEVTSFNHNLNVFNTAKERLSQTKFYDIYDNWYVKYNHSAYNCGICGFNDLSYLKECVLSAYELFDEFNNSEIYIHPSFYEQSYLTAMLRRDEKNVATIIPYDLIEKHGEFEAMNMMEYAHYWGDGKFNSTLMYYIRKTIFNYHNNYFNNILEFEKTLHNKNITVHKNTEFYITFEYDKL